MRRNPSHPLYPTQLTSENFGAGALALVPITHLQCRALPNGRNRNNIEMVAPPLKKRGPFVSSKSSKPGKSGNLSVPVTLLPVLKLLWNRTLNDEIPPRLSVDRAWTIYLAAHANVDAADHRRCTLERYLRDRWNAGENDPEELTCLGLSFLWRLERDNW